MEIKSNSEDHNNEVAFSLSYRLCKRIVDIVFSSLALIVLSPIFVLVLILDHVDQSSRGPLFYRQTRIGLHGKRFGMYKFRSMVVNAEQKLHANKELYAMYVNNNYKLEPQVDPRITKIGRFLRETSIDEIPQFINILRGEMSIVGPRPVVEEELVEYNQNKLLSVKPGAMGLWQASGRSKIGYPERARIEMSYIDRANLFYDFKIIIMNLVNIFLRKGAY
ncbi:sugar transferase [Lactiplantibacillus nangangensis]|uniref:Sugar transferase n=1 Tax=Lactiplantibacillus nangangensis TaxID=2559917 RepID=A0ABW1SIX1_9LACO|nr:sugar transferase [Lactiplantibacillus nangangensis]